MSEKHPAPRRLGFYRRLTHELRREYDRSDERTSLPLRPSQVLRQTTNDVVQALGSGSPPAVRHAAQRLVDEICSALAEQSRGDRAPRTPKVKVLKTRPRLAQSEFHGLYTRYESGESEIKVWMFTAALKQIVKPRTFLRTLLHELCHHVDMTWLGLPSSLHTIGFHARESSLLRSLERSGARVPGGDRGDDRDPDARQHGVPIEEEAPKPRAPQLELFKTPSARSASARRRERSD